MERDQYTVMFLREEHHWWYAGMRYTALALLEQGLAANSTGPVGSGSLRLLDAGCGTGGTTAMLRRFGNVVGADLQWDALVLACRRDLRGRLVRGTIERVPARDASFDVVTSFDVVYHLGVHDDARAFDEFHRVLRPGGLLLLRLPAHDWLRGEHDRLVHTRHRYGRTELVAKLLAAGFQIERLTWANTALFPPAAGKRLLERWTARNAGAGHAAREPDLWQPPGPLNTLLEQVLRVEALAIRARVPLPFGLSLLALARAA